MIYLASPYSNCDPTIREARFREACRAAAKLMRLGHAVFSPIAHGHCIAAFGLPTDWRYWEPLDRWQLERCSEVVVLQLEGWKQSPGVQAEIQIATELGKPVRYLGPDWLPTLVHVATEAEG